MHRNKHEFALATDDHSVLGFFSKQVTFQTLIPELDALP